MKIVRESINFERGIDPKEAMNIGSVFFTFKAHDIGFKEELHYNWASILKKEDIIMRYFITYDINSILIEDENLDFLSLK